MAARTNSSGALELPKVAFHGQQVEDTLRKWHEEDMNAGDESQLEEEDIDLNFEDHTVRHEILPIVARGAEEEGTPRITIDERVNLLLQINIEDKEYLEEYRSRLALVPPYLERINRSYYLLLRDMQPILASRVFIVLTSENPLNVEQLNRVRGKESFIRFSTLIFRRPLHFFALTEQELSQAKSALTRLKRKNALLRAQPLRPLTVPKEDNR